MSERRVTVTTEYSAGLRRGLADAIRPLAPAIIYFANHELPEDQTSSADVVAAINRGETVRTAAINPTRIQQSFEEIPGDILHIATGDHFTNNHNSAAMAAREIGDGRVEVFNTETVSAGVALTALEAEKWAEQGLSRDEIITKLQNFLPRLHVIGYVDNMMYAARGGRVGEVVDRIKQVLGGNLVDSALSKFAATVHMDRNKPHDFDVKPKVLAAVKKTLIGKIVESVSQAIETKPLECVMVAYPEDTPAESIPASAQKVADEINRLHREKHGRDVEIYLTPMSPSVTAHIGPGSLGVAYVESQ